MDEAHRCAVRSRVIVALDSPSLDAALALARSLASGVGLFKVGLELFNSAGPAAIAALRGSPPRGLGTGVFYDAKLYDIPNTVSGAAAAIGRMGVSMLNVHALAGRAVMRAAKEGAARGAAESGLPAPLVIGVTVITSLGDTELHEELGLPGTAVDAVRRLAVSAREAGLDGVVCAAHETPDIKRLCGTDFLTVAPGIRPAWAVSGDQTRVATPRAALEAGADYLVIGRPITRAADPRQALERILQELA